MTTTTTTPATPEDDTARTGSLRGDRTPRGPVGWLLDLFSSIWLGVILLTLLFVYSSIGSAGFWLPHTGYFHVRQLRMFEMTEFEWFHYWPFSLLIALICINLVVATLRRIPFKPINYGVWMIHSGIIILALSSVWYFGTKVEGESIVGRRMVTLSLPGAEPVTMAAQPGRSAEISNDEVSYSVQVTDINPHWEMLSGPDKGDRDYAVTLSIQKRSTDGEQFFMRQLLAEHPENTEDIVRTNNHTQPMQRAKNVNPDGDPLLDKTLVASLEYDPTEHFYLVNSSALYMRSIDAQGNPTTDWIERPIDGLPRYHDYISDYETVWLPTSELPPPQHQLQVEVSPTDDADDPLAGKSITITDYLRYAIMDDRRMPGGDTLDPVVTLELSAPDGRRARYELVANDPARNSAENGELLFTWVDTQQQLDALRNAPGPTLQISVPASDFSETATITSTLRRNPQTPFIDLGDTGYSYRVQRMENNLVINPELTMSVAMVQVRGPGGREFVRMVRTDGTEPMDFPVSQATTGHEQPLPLDQSITMSYDPGQRTAAVTVIAGPQRDQLHVLNAIDPSNPVFQSIEDGTAVDLGGATLAVKRYSSFTTVETRPAVIAQSQRQRDVGSQLSMIRAAVPTASGAESVWLPFHLFAFESEGQTMRRFRYEPVQVVVDDRGTPEVDDDQRIELMYSRRRLPLPVPVALENFIVTAHTGGFDRSSGTASIRNWTSVVRFAGEADGGPWGDRREVSVNEPIEYDGYWFFQSQWDAPDGTSNGMNYTVLGVGNRNGVNVMLAGCCIAVIGMLYAFYVKPIIRRRRIVKVHEEVARRAATTSLNGETGEAAQAIDEGTLESVGAGSEEQRS